MKALIPIILVITAAGCATPGTIPGAQGSGGYTVVAAATESAAATDSAPATIAPPFQDQNLGPRIIIPTTGGAPILGIPLGGNIYLPLTGGAPVIGIPIAP
jgi:hypothetical protein